MVMVRCCWQLTVVVFAAVAAAAVAAAGVFVCCWAGSHVESRIGYSSGRQQEHQPAGAGAVGSWAGHRASVNILERCGHACDYTAGH